MSVVSPAPPLPIGGGRRVTGLEDRDIGPAARRLPATARHKKGARVACNGRKKTALAAVSAFLSRASKPGAAIERHRGIVCAGGVGRQPVAVAKRCDECCLFLLGIVLRLQSNFPIAKIVFA